jgi:hypothetical protein
LSEAPPRTLQVFFNRRPLYWWVSCMWYLGQCQYLQFPQAFFLHLMLKYFPCNGSTTKESNAVMSNNTIVFSVFIYRLNNAVINPRIHIINISLLVLIILLTISIAAFLYLTASATHTCHVLFLP